MATCSVCGLAPANFMGLTNGYGEIVCEACYTLWIKYTKESTLYLASVAIVSAAKEKAEYVREHAALDVGLQETLDILGSSRENGYRLRDIARLWIATKGKLPK